MQQFSLILTERKWGERESVCVCAAAAQTHLPSGLNSKLLPKQEPVPDTQKGIDVATINFL